MKEDLGYPYGACYTKKKRTTHGQNLKVKTKKNGKQNESKPRTSKPTKTRTKFKQKWGVSKIKNDQQAVETDKEHRTKTTLKVKEKRVMGQKSKSSGTKEKTGQKSKSNIKLEKSLKL